MIGNSLGPYRIIEQLGAGGMGEVYLAEDTRLGRKVAVKVLPAEFAVDRERLARFEQEAKAAAALNHPHIAAVFDVGSELLHAGAGAASGQAGDPRTDPAAAAAAPTHFMVQEYLEGHTLRTALDKGALPVGKALLYAREIAEALGAAHAAGIIHRDLKPDNVFITKDGHAKVLDFGLAKLTELHGPAGRELSMSPTVLGTVAGQIMGTAGYMAPEQIEGTAEIDARADLFAFGCLLYEMAGGKRAFGGDSVLDTLHAIARTDPQPVGEINPALPADLERIIRKCLAKDRDNRYQHAEDVLVDLRNLAAEVDAGTARSVADRAAGGGELVAVAAGLPWKLAVPAALVVAVIAALATWALTAGSLVPADGRVMRFALALPEDVNLTSAQWPSLAMSPGGDFVAVAANAQIYLRAIGDIEAAPLRGTEGPSLIPFFSPDGESIGFWAEGELRKVSTGGGAAVKLTDLPDPPFGASWSADNGILYAADGIWRVSGDGGEPEQLIAGDSGELHGPQLLPDGSILYTLSSQPDSSWDDARIVVQRPGEAEPTVLVSGGRDARWLSTGHIVYALEDAVLARSFDPATRTVGGAVPLLQGVLGGFEVTGAAQFATADTGDLVYIPGEGQGAEPRSFVWRDEDGSTEIVAPANEAGRTWTPRISPDGRYVAYRVDGPNGNNIWMLDLQRGIHSLFTPGAGARSFAWSPDGRWLYYSADSGTDAGTNVYRRRADMSADAEEFLGGDGNELVRSISPDGNWLLYADATTLSTGAYDISVISLNEPGDPAPVFDREIQEITAAFSPNGRWVAYVAGEQELRVFVQAYPDLGGVTQVSDGFGTEPLWAPDSKRLFYRRETDIMVVDVLSEEPFDVSAPRVFLPEVLSLSDRQNAGSYDISPDGRRLLMVDWDSANGAGEVGLEIVLNWFRELRERVPTGR